MKMTKMKNNIQIGDSVHIESINKTGLLVQKLKQLGLDWVGVLFPDETVGFFVENEVELIVDETEGI